MRSILHPRSAVELFHCQFLARLDKAIPWNSYAVKGGCNLRMLLGSPRASEDLDLDVRQVAKHTLAKQVESVLKQLRSVLLRQNIKVSDTSAPKQTDTVQRWKVALKLLGQDVWTKIEFSRRILADTPLRGTLTQKFQDEYLPEGATLSHYGTKPALKQKLEALAGRKITQARDVFDIAFLIGIGTEPPSLNEETIREAEQNTRFLKFQDYSGQVIPYLDESHAEEFGSEEAWERLQRQVLGLLKSIPPTQNEENPELPNKTE